MPSAWLSPPSTWLVRPDSALPGGRYRLHVTLPERIAFATGIRRAPSSEDNTFEASIDTFDESSFAAFGSLRVQRIAPGVDLVMTPGLRVSDSAVVEWAKASTASGETC